MLSVDQEASKRIKAMEEFIRNMRDRWMTEMIARSGNVEFVNTRAAILRDQAADLLEE